jgi:CRISPR-associated protein Cas1
MPEVIQNTLYLTTPGTYIARDHLTLQIEVPMYSPDLPREKRTKDQAVEIRKLSLPIHHLESICIFGPSITLSAPALALCWEYGAAVNYLSEWGKLQARMTGVADTSVMLRRVQFRAADDPSRCTQIARTIIAGKIQNARNSLLRAARENSAPDECVRLSAVTDAMAHQLRDMDPARPEADAATVDTLRGGEGMASKLYFMVLPLAVKQQREAFAFNGRNRRPPRDRINCLLSFLYALVRHDCISALTTAGLDPFVGFLHVDRPNRSSLALDLMEEFRPWLADRLALTLINRQQIGPGHFLELEGGAVEFTDAGRKAVITAYQERKKESMRHPLFDQNLRIGQIPFVQARILARHLRGDLADYIPHVPK